jgi:hypothetical protein
MYLTHGTLTSAAFAKGTSSTSEVQQAPKGFQFLPALPDVCTVNKTQASPQIHQEAHFLRP